MGWPTKRMSYPSGVVLAENGNLPPDKLSNVEFFGGSGPDGRIYGKLNPTVTRCWFWLVLLCLNETGRKLTVTSTADAYRTYAIQEWTFRNRYRCPRTTLCSSDSKMWQGSQWFRRLGVAMAATPGTSNHGQGLALDIAVWSPNALGVWKAQAVAGDRLLWDWLITNAPTFGFYWNVPSESWHLEFVEADSIPQRVLDIEAWLGAAPG